MRSSLRSTRRHPPAFSRFESHAVFDGRLAVTAFGAQVEFGLREYFLVPDNNVPQRVLTPPEFMLTRVDSSAPTTLLASLSLPQVPEPQAMVAALPGDTGYQSTEDRDRPPLLPQSESRHRDACRCGQRCDARGP
jgi:hypothetical protein